MNNIKSISIAALSVFVIAGKAVAQQAPPQLTTDQILGQVNTITTAVPFLIITPDSRAGGMGDAGVASSPDANSVHWNASKLAFIPNKFGVSMSYTPWLRQLVPDIALAYLSAYWKKDQYQTLGASLRYFSLGNIVFTDIVGNTIGQFNPNEFAVDLAYARKLAEKFSGGIALRYINSNLTGGISTQSATNTHPGQAVAADVSMLYQDQDIEVGGKKSTLRAGLAITNIGSKISYSNATNRKDFIPINMRLGSSLTMDMDDYNSLAFVFDVNKLLVPTYPIYNAQNEIIAGKDPYRGVTSGMFGSFSDAPGGGKEELREIIWCGGMEYWYDKQFAVRGGYFYENKLKGNRKFFTLGAGLKYNVFALDFAYLIPTVQANPLQNTLRFTLRFDFESSKSKDKGGDNSSSNNTF